MAHPEHFAYNLECIGERAFYGCSSLTNFVVGRHLSEISSSAFLNCQNIESFDVHPSNITYRCENGCLIRSSDNTLIAVAGKMSFVQIPEGVVAIVPYAFSENTNVVSVITPTSLTNICDYAFYGCTKLDNIQLNEGLIDIGYQSFYDCKELSNIEFPNTLISIQSHAFEGCEKIRSVSFPPSMKNLGGYSFRGCKRLIKYNVPVGLKIEDGTFDGCGVFLVDVISTAMRQSDPTIMDIVYRVSFKTNECVSVRMLAYKNGERSLYNVIRPETFVDGTEKNIGEGIPVNQDIKVSWKVSADWSETLSEINVEVMAERKNRYSWRYMIIPSKDSGKKIKVYMNSIGPLQTYDALLWLYASKDPDIKIENGNLYGNGQLLASGKYLKVINSGWEAGNVDYKRHDSSAAVFVLPKLGFKVLSADELSHFSTLTRIPSSKELSDSTDSRPYYDYYAWTRLYMPYVYCGEYVEE